MLLKMDERAAEQRIFVGVVQLSQVLLTQVNPREAAVNDIYKVVNNAVE